MGACKGLTLVLRVEVLPKCLIFLTRYDAPSIPIAPPARAVAPSTSRFVIVVEGLKMPECRWKRQVRVDVSGSGGSKGPRVAQGWLGEQELFSVLKG